MPATWETHDGLIDRVHDLRAHARIACKHDRNATAGPVLVLRATTLLKDVYRLVSREPGARALEGIDPLHPPSNVALVTLLHDAKHALDLFEWNHRQHDERHGEDDWITVESVEQERQSMLAYRREKAAKDLEMIE